MPEAGAVNSGSAGAVNVSPRLEKAITELQGLQELLLSGDGLDSRILTDFREALNRIRNTAWSAQQYIALHTCPNYDCGKVAQRSGTTRRYSVNDGRGNSCFGEQVTWARKGQRERVGSRRSPVEGWGSRRAVPRCLRAW